MATDVTIGGDGTLFVGEDKTFRLEVLVHEEDGVYDSDSVPVNIAGKSIVFDVRTKDNAQTQLLFKSATVIGTYSATRSVNTQRAVVTVTDTEMNVFKGSNLPVGAKEYRHSWKIMNADGETVLARGDFLPEKATAD